MDRNILKTGIINLVALLAIAVASQFVAQFSGCLTAQISVFYLTVGVLVAAVSAFQMRLANRERIEQLELSELKRSASAAALFDSTEAELYPARRAREQFDRFFVPGFALLLLILLGLAVYVSWPWTGKSLGPQIPKATITMALTALFSLILFLLGKYSAGVARLEGQRLLQPSASALLMGSVCCLLITLAEAAAWFGFPLVDRWTSRLLILILGLVALEMAVSLILEIYRPRVKGQATRLLYESRLIGLLGQPGGLITTAAQALDYQFGFKVSETWFYQFLEKALAWLILLQLGVLALSTTIVIVEPNEQALLERLGKPVAGRNVLESGLHFKWPWPIDIAYKYNTREVHTFYVGFVPDPEADQERLLLWTRPHYEQEFNLLVASRETVASSSTSPQTDQAVPVNLLAVNIPIQYQIRDLVSWAYQHSNGADLLDKIANREVVRYLVNVDIEAIMTTGRLKAADAIRERIQAQVDQNKLGVEILFVGLQSIHPPVAVAPAYEEVIGALQEKETNILGAQAYWIEKIPLAYADATNLVTRAKSDGLTKVTTAAADAGQFRNQMLAYSASPQVFRQRSYLETLVQAVRPARKYVLATTNTTEIIWLNLEDKLRTDLLDVTVPKPR